MRRALLPVAAVALLLAGCTGVPESSSPQVIGPVGGLESSAPPSITPSPGADQRSIVKGFLTALATEDQRHSAARTFLTPKATNLWSDKTVTVVDSELIGNYDPVTRTVTVRGRPVAAISAAGVYTPVLRGDGTGGDPVTFVFGMTKAAGQWRIDTLKNGLVLTSAQFQETFQQRRLYFYDLTERRLVPDPRFTALLDSNQLANWLVAQLVSGPRPELQNAVNTELPAQTDPHGVTVSTGTLTTVEVPGAGQLDATTRNHLAAQLAFTLDQVTGPQPIAITDGGQQVLIPAIGGTQFSSADFGAAVEPANLGPSLFFVRNGAVVDEDGRPLPGGFGSGAYSLNSVALASAGSTDLWVAGTTGPVDNARLLVGSESHGLHDTRVRGYLSRPAWAPNIDEVWVGDGNRIARASSTGRPSEVPVTTTSGRLAGRVAALRFSPEGSRIALVLAAPDGTAQVWIGSVVRTSDQVRIDSLEAITPVGIVVTDVAWNDQLKLFTIGRNVATGESAVFEVQVDGSLWTPRSIADLPQAPDSITVAEYVSAWVSAGNAVFTQRGSSWTNPNGVPTSGTNPVYLE